jgi:hypothetical protein
MKVEFEVEVEGEVVAVTIEAACVGHRESVAKAAAVGLADDTASRGQQALVFRCQRRWQRGGWVDGRREIVYDTAAAASDGGPGAPAPPPFAAP